MKVTIKYSDDQISNKYKVDDYGRIVDANLFYYDRNGYRTFVNMNFVKEFGGSDD